MRAKIFLFVFLGALAPALFSYAQSNEVAERRVALERELAGLEAEIESQRALLDDLRGRSQTLERDVAILNASIKQSELAIRARNLAIQKLSRDIGGKEETIGALSDKIERSRASLIQILRATARWQADSLPLRLLADGRLVGFLTEMGSYASVERSLVETLEGVRVSRAEVEGEKQTLEDRRTEETTLRVAQERAQARLEAQKAEKDRILKLSKGIEANYQSAITSKEYSAAKIRSELFTLRDSAAIPFEKALLLARQAEAATGVRAAFLLGVIAEESNLGENVGTGSWRIDMKAPRDTEPFLDITRRLGLDPDRMPVSKKAWYGYGGAMGPAQFIPSTWILYEERIAKATGHRPPNPWDPGDAFVGAALYLRDSGAAKRTPAAERFAAICYLAGCGNAHKKAYAFYGDEVADLTAKYQKQIDILGG
jgi:membrane-bound lytic murein transglycosylase B